jgi:hypothetical protein
MAEEVFDVEKDLPFISPHKNGTEQAIGILEGTVLRKQETVVSLFQQVSQRLERLSKCFQIVTVSILFVFIN